jgi:hypothetical protein
MKYIRFLVNMVIIITFPLWITPLLLCMFLVLMFEIFSERFLWERT